jgi:hypothetical protein
MIRSMLHRFAEKHPFTTQTTGVMRRTNLILAPRRDLPALQPGHVVDCACYAIYTSYAFPIAIARENPWTT